MCVGIYRCDDACVKVHRCAEFPAAAHAKPDAGPHRTFQSTVLESYRRQARARHARRDDLRLRLDGDELRPAFAFQTQQRFGLRRTAIAAGFCFVGHERYYGAAPEGIFMHASLRESAAASVLCQCQRPAQAGRWMRAR